MHNDQYDVIIIGAGPSGAVSAAYLTNKNLSVLVIEKENFPRFVIGESLLPHCMDHLQEAGLLESIKDKEFQVKTGAAFYRGDERCDFLFKDQFTKGWEWTYQVKRASFDKALIDEAEKKGVKVLYKCEVINVECSDTIQAVKFKDKDKNECNVSGKFIIDASGYGRVLPKLFNLNEPSDLIARGSIFSHVADKNRTEKEGNNIFIHSFNNNESWLWAIPFSDGITSIGIVGKESVIVDMAKNNSKKYKSFIQDFLGLNERFKDSELVFEPKNILGYSIGIKKMHGDGYVICGNSTEFLDPVFSSGVTLATASGLIAAKLVERKLKGEIFDWNQEYDQIILKGVEVFRSYINAWYNGTLQTIFFAKEIDPEIKNQICSVLAGYVWDETNPFVKKHKTILPTLAKVITMKQ